MQSENHIYRGLNGSCNLYTIGQNLSAMESDVKDIPLFMRDIRRYIEYLPVRFVEFYPENKICFISDMYARNQFTKALFLCRRFYKRTIMRDITSIGEYLQKSYLPYTETENIIPCQNVIDVVAKIIKENRMLWQGFMPSITFAVLPDTYTGTTVATAILPPYVGGKTIGKPFYNIFLHANTHAQLTQTRLEKSIASAMAYCLVDAYVRVPVMDWQEMLNMLRSSYIDLTPQEYDINYMGSTETIRNLYKKQGIRIDPLHYALASALLGANDWTLQEGKVVAKETLLLIRDTLSDYYAGTD